MRFSHRLAPTRDQSQSGSVIRPKQSRAHQPQLTCMLTKGLSVDPAVFLFGWLAWGRPSPSRSSPVCFSESKGTGPMPTGLFKTSDQAVQVDYHGVRSRYLDRLMRITATSRISATCPSKPNIGRQRRSRVMSRAPKGAKRPADV